MSSCQECLQLRGSYRSTTATRTQQQSSSPRLLFEVQRHGAQFLLDVADDLTLRSRSKAVTELRRDFVELSVQAPSTQSR